MHSVWQGVCAGWCKGRCVQLIAAVRDIGSQVVVVAPGFDVVRHQAVGVVIASVQEDANYRFVVVGGLGRSFANSGQAQGKWRGGSGDRGQ